MSKDKYRPSTADFEVTKSSIKRDDNLIVDETGSLIHGPSYGDDDASPNVGESEEEFLRRRAQELIPGYMEEETLARWIPKGLKVVNQVVRYSHDGRMRVDVTFEWDSMPEASSYFVRVSPEGT